MWLEFESYLKTIYWKEKVLWTGSYFAASCGGVTIEKLKQYVQRQDSPTTQILPAIHPADKSGVFLRKKDKVLPPAIA